MRKEDILRGTSESTTPVDNLWYLLLESPARKLPLIAPYKEEEMNGLKDDIDLSFLKGRELVQVSIGLYQTAFRFDEDVAVSVEGEFYYFDGQREWKWQPTPGSSLAAARTTTLLGMTVDDVSGSRDGVLTLDFSNGHRLVIIDSNKEFESYDITRPGQTIVV